MLWRILWLRASPLFNTHALVLLVAVLMVEFAEDAIVLNRLLPSDPWRDEMKHLYAPLHPFHPKQVMCKDNQGAASAAPDARNTKARRAAVYDSDAHYFGDHAGLDVAAPRGGLHPGYLFRAHPFIIATERCIPMDNGEASEEADDQEEPGPASRKSQKRKLKQEQKAEWTHGCFGFRLPGTKGTVFADVARTKDLPEGWQSERIVRYIECMLAAGVCASSVTITELELWQASATSPSAPRLSRASSRCLGECLLQLVHVCSLLFQVWHYPSQSPRDAIVLEAVEPPPGSWLSMNCLVLSQHGPVNTLLAGGDLEGDLNQASWWRSCVCGWSELVKIIEETEPDAQDFVALETEALQGVEEVKTSWSADGVAERCPLAAWCDAYMNRARFEVKTMPLRGGYDEEDFQAKLHLALAMDAPKKFPIEMFQARMGELRRLHRLGHQAVTGGKPSSPEEVKEARAARKAAELDDFRARAAQGATVVIDLEWEDSMQPKELKSLIQQVLQLASR
eukprot:s1668_g3.t1